MKREEIQAAAPIETAAKPTICPDFDEDCLTMSAAHANWCFMGCQNHPCGTPSFGTTKGQCPIIQPNN